MENNYVKICPVRRTTVHKIIVVWPKLLPALNNTSRSQVFTCVLRVLLPPRQQQTFAILLKLVEGPLSSFHNNTKHSPYYWESPTLPFIYWMWGNSEGDEERLYWFGTIYRWMGVKSEEYGRKPCWTIYRSESYHSHSHRKFQSPIGQLTQSMNRQLEFSNHSHESRSKKAQCKRALRDEWNSGGWIKDLMCPIG